MDLSAADADPSTQSIIWAGFPGMHGGAAIADAIFARSAVSPAALSSAWSSSGVGVSRFGKLSQTWYGKEFVKEADMTDFRLRPGPAYCATPDNCFNSTTGRGHRFYTGKPHWKFGDGLSYTTWRTTVGVMPALGAMNDGGVFPTRAATIQHAAVARAHAASKTVPHNASTVAIVQLSITNVGHVDGDYVALLFARPPNAGVAGVPLQTLVDFQRVRVNVNERASVQFRVKASAMTVADGGGTFSVSRGNWVFFVREQGVPDEASASLSLV